MKKKDEKTNVETTRNKFFALLNKAIKPLVPEEDETKESRTSGDYSGKRTRQRKAEGAED